MRPAPCRQELEAVPPNRSWSAGPADGVAAVPLPRPCRCGRSQAPPPPDDRPQITSPEAAADLLLPLLADRDREQCTVLLLDVKHRLRDVVTVSIGSIDHTFMSPREVMRDALIANAAALVLAHNHPSGDPEPSTDDQAVTERLVRAGEVLGIDVLDHLVIGGSRWVSIARRGGV